MEEMKSKVYVLCDAEGRIIRCDGGYTTPTNLEDWVQIDEGTGDKFNLCQSHYFEDGLYTADFIPKYKLIDGKVVERTESEIESDRKPSYSQQIDTLKSLLSSTDYKAIKYAEGEISEEDYQPILLQRREWRKQINELQKLEKE